MPHPINPEGTIGIKDGYHYYHLPDTDAIFNDEVTLRLLMKSASPQEKEVLQEKLTMILERRNALDFLFGSSPEPLMEQELLAELRVRQNKFAGYSIGCTSKK